MTRKLDVDVGELIIALQTDHYEAQHYLDLETGEIILMVTEYEREAESVYEEMYGEGEEAPDLAEYLEEHDYQDWEKEMILLAQRIEEGYPQRYIRIDRDDPYAGYNDMEAFIYTVENAELRERLDRAIRGRGAFRRFKDLLLDHLDVREDWFAFQDERQRRRALAWLEARRIEVEE